MRAVILQKFGSPGTLTLGEVPPPEIKAGQVEIDVRYAGVNPVDFKIRDNKVTPLLRLKPPLVMGNECSGVVHRIGAGVTRFKTGDVVFTRVGKTDLGAFADFACVPEALVAKVPPSMGLKEAGALPLVGLTALQVLFDVGGLKSGERVFIQAGSGGVGTIAIQLARRAGAHVITTASGVGAVLCERLGAHEVIDYKKQRWQQVVHDVDLVFDTLGGNEVLDAFQAIKEGGRVVSIQWPPTVEIAREMGVSPFLWPGFWVLSARARAAARRRQGSYAYHFLRPSGAQLEELGALVERKELEVIIDKVFPFDQALEALAYVEAGRTKGKVVLAMDKKDEKIFPTL